MKCKHWEITADAVCVCARAFLQPKKKGTAKEVQGKRGWHVRIALSVNQGSPCLPCNPLLCL